MIHAIDIEAARSRNHEPTAVRPELGLVWPESAHGRTAAGEIRCRAASLDSEWSEEIGAPAGPGGPGPSRRRRLAAGRAEPDPAPICWRLVTLQCHQRHDQTTAMELFRNGSLLSLMRIDSD